MIVKIRRGIYLIHLRKRQVSSSRVLSPTAWQCSPLVTAQEPSFGVCPLENPEHVGSLWVLYLKLLQQQQHNRKTAKAIPRRNAVRYSEF